MESAANSAQLEFECHCKGSDCEDVSELEFLRTPPKPGHYDATRTGAESHNRECG